ncbi:MarR family winged helix-turn-helix transcriptional regulator [Brachybacterium huguangmaarense]
MGDVMGDGRAWRNDGTFHLMRRVMQAHHALWRDRVPHLTPVQYGVLLSIRNLPGADQRTIGEAAAVEPTTLAALVPRLESAGLITRCVCPDDRRRNNLDLTDAGREALQEAAPHVLAVRDELLARLDDEDARHLRRILGALADGADAGPA